jgi:hypothetical protein
MWEPRHLTTLWASTACYRDSFAFLSLPYEADISSVTNKLSVFEWTEFPLPCSWTHATGIYPEETESIPHLHHYFLGSILISCLCQCFPSDLFPSLSPTEFCTHFSLSPSLLVQIPHHVAFSSTSIAHCRWLRPVQITERETMAGRVCLLISKWFSHCFNQLQYYSKKLSIFRLYVVNIMNTGLGQRSA